MFSKLLVTAGAFLMLSACGDNNTTGPSTNPDPAPPGSTTITIVPGASGLTTTAYSPNPITVSVGTMVSWLNNDGTAHTTTADNNAWNSQSLAPGRRFNMTFTTAGTFPYKCTLHPGMVGTLTVQ